MNNRRRNTAKMLKHVFKYKVNKPTPPQFGGLNEDSLKDMLFL